MRRSHEVDERVFSKNTGTFSGSISVCLKGHDPSRMSEKKKLLLFSSKFFGHT
jgi:hypothetical protein